MPQDLVKAKGETVDEERRRARARGFSRVCAAGEFREGGYRPRPVRRGPRRVRALHGRPPRWGRGQLVRLGTPGQAGPNRTAALPRIRSRPGPQCSRGGVAHRGGSAARQQPGEAPGTPRHGARARTLRAPALRVMDVAGPGGALQVRRLLIAASPRASRKTRPPPPGSTAKGGSGKCAGRPE
jgi:hypothetical protein